MVATAIVRAFTGAVQNLLRFEKSPYLRQHQHNPVAWQPWGDAAFALAKERDVPVFLSIGYSTCHWCHVMERESFESEAIAQLLNERFVPIKVDREERPDVDAIYMDAVQAMTGHGGWPMSVWLTADAAPFFTGTYFTPDRFATLLERISAIWQEQRDLVLAQGSELLAALARGQERPGAGSVDETALVGLWRQWLSRFDPQHGGFRGAPKFPQAADLRLLLRLYHRSGNRQALTMVRTTLDAMARGGIYDHLGGGFARYSVDGQWIVPHFEKMLYDQAALTLAYLEAWQVTGQREDELVVRETLDYVLHDLGAPTGAFYCAEDADSEGEEGKFYVFTAAELRTLLGDEFASFAASFAVTESGNFEHGTNVLTLAAGHARANRSERVRGAMQQVLDYRNKRVRPGRDDKVLSDWNGLMIGALARAGRALGEPRYVAAARRAMSDLLTNALTPAGRLLHRYCDGQAAISGFVDDYAFVIQALIDLYQATFEPSWIDRAVALQSSQDEIFWDDRRGDYRFSDGSDPRLPVRRFESHDGVVPAGRSVAAMNLLRLSALLVRPEWGRQALRLLAATPMSIQSAPAAYAQLLLAVDYATDRAKEVAIVGSDDAAGVQAMCERLARSFLPNVTVAAGNGVALLAGRPALDGKATAYVCEAGSCQPPTSDPERLREMAAACRPLSVEG